VTDTGDYGLDVADLTITATGEAAWIGEPPTERPAAPEPASSAAPADIDAIAERLMAHLPAHARQLAAAIVALGANSEWDSEAVEILADPIQRAAVDAGLPPFGSSGPDDAYHAFYGRIALHEGIETDYEPEDHDEPGDELEHEPGGDGPKQQADDLMVRPILPRPGSDPSLVPGAIPSPGTAPVVPALPGPA
jgi:hypothetical protein